jgi:hypothetical protein
VSDPKVREFPESAETGRKEREAAEAGEVGILTPPRSIREQGESLANIEHLPSSPSPAHSPPSPAEAEADNGDFVDQLRNVHYLLVIACLALLVIANSQKETSEAERASRDIVSLSNFVVDWNENSSMPSVVEDHLRILIKNGALSPLAFPNSIYIKATDGSNHGINIEVPHPDFTWMLSTRSAFAVEDSVLTPGDILSPRTSPAYDTGLRPHDGGTPPSIEDLRDLKAVWNMLDDHPFLVSIDAIKKVSLFKGDERYDASVTVFCDDPMALPASCVKRDSVDGLVTVPRTSVYGASSGLSTIDILKTQAETLAASDSRTYGQYAKYMDMARLDSPKDGYCGYESEFAVGDQKPTYILLMQTDCDSIRYNWQKELWKYDDLIQFGKYSVSFPELSAASERLQDVPIDTVQKYLHRLAEKAAAAFEIFGTKIPAEAVSLWGPLIIIGIGIYCYLNVSELRNRLKPNDKAWNKAWLGVHNFFGSKLAMLISIGIFPPFTIIICAVIPRFASNTVLSMAALRDFSLLFGSAVIGAATLWKWWGIMALRSKWTADDPDQDDSG